MCQIHVQWWHFLTAIGFCVFWWCCITKVWSVHHIIIVMFINWVCYRRSLEKWQIHVQWRHFLRLIAYPRHFCILCTRPKSCFGGLNEQSGYLVWYTLNSLCLHFLWPSNKVLYGFYTIVEKFLKFRFTLMSPPLSLKSTDGETSRLVLVRVFCGFYVS